MIPRAGRITYIRLYGRQNRPTASPAATAGEVAAFLAATKALIAGDTTGPIALISKSGIRSGHALAGFKAPIASMLQVWSVILTRALNIGAPAACPMNKFESTIRALCGRAFRDPLS